MPFLGKLIPIWLVALVCFAAGAASTGTITYKIMDGKIANERLARAEALQKQKDEAAAILAAAIERKTEKERALGARVAELEGEHVDREKYVYGLRLAHGRLLAATCGMYDKNGRRREGSGGAPGQDPAGTISAGEPEAPLACLLPVQAREDLGDLALDADLSEGDAVTGADYAASLAPILNAP